ncbi:LolA family protein [Geothermobacter hydrogeniphilus]|uniref:DUF4292 domain-containing protein n=1 Tax=Geothermobacter hydrogeniphilus TaxID=1969733 RepID=A0A1X0Y8T5_9BACT|nr:DUF4292 domain-containing protein [Geothermobacter hydrogeniphilus]ORJ61536.1 hypothetical protein B5V00_05725 [Geothermobacter hydrogeniphilus]
MSSADRVRLVLICLVPILLQACAVPRPAAPPVVDVGARELLQHLESSARRLQSLRGLARVRVESPQRNFGATQVLLVSKPNRLRAETLSLFGTPMLLLSSDGRQLQVLVPGQNRFYQGAASGRNLQRFTNLPLRLEDLVHLLLYQVPLLADVERLEADAAGPLLFLSGDGDRRQELQFDNQLRLVRCRLSRGGAVWLDIGYGDFSAEQNFPRSISLRLPQRDILLEVQFRQLEINPQLDPRRFVLVRPAGAKLIALPGD